MKIALSIAALLTGLGTALSPATAARLQPVVPTATMATPSLAAAEKSAVSKKKRLARKAGKKTRSGAAKPAGKS